MWISRGVLTVMGTYSHFMRECKQSASLCKNCGEYGHLAAACKRVVNNNRVTAMMMNQLTETHAVCVQLKCDIGAIYMVSKYCQFSLDICPFLNYLVRAKCDTARSPPYLLSTFHFILD